MTGFFASLPNSRTYPIAKLNMTTETFHKKKYYQLDLLRGIAAVVVALSHFEIGSISVSHISGGLCVGFFFILSGFVLSHAYQAEVANKKLEFKNYFIARLARLYPLHLITLIAVASFYGAVYLARSIVPVSPSIGLHASFLQLVEALTLTHLLLGQSVGFNTPSWSISVELWCSVYLFLLFIPGYRWAKNLSMIIIVFAFTVV
jgi:peptidoglycan/LPS O-acetylase OafA/YrhL